MKQVVLDSRKWTVEREELRATVGDRKRSQCIMIYDYPWSLAWFSSFGIGMHAAPSRFQHFLSTPSLLHYYLEFEPEISTTFEHVRRSAQGKHQPDTYYIGESISKVLRPDTVLCSKVLFPGLIE